MLNKRFLGVAALLAIFAASAVSQLPRHGRMLPDVPIQTLTKPINLKQYRGKPLVVALISTTCAHCVDALEALKQVQARFAPAGLQVIAAAGDPNVELTLGSYAAKYRLNFPLGYLAQEPFMKLADIKPGVRPFVPIVMFIDRTGMVRTQYFGDDGAIKQDVGAVIRLTAEQLMKDPPAPANTASK